MKSEDQALFEEFLEFKKFKKAITELEPKKIKKRKREKYSLRPNGTYSTQVNVGRDLDTGKILRVTLYAKTIAELDEKVAEIRVEKQRGTKFSKKNITIGQYRVTWFESKKLGIELNTKKMYETIFNNYFKDIDDIKMCEVELEDLQNVINKNKDKERTCQKIRMVFNELFKAAIRERMISYNPAEGLVIPQYRAVERRSLTAEEDYLTETTLFSDREKAFILCIKYFGLRKEEALALSKSDFDFKNKSLKISKAMIFDNNRPIVKETKNGIIRILPILSNIEPFLRYYISNLHTDALFVNITNHSYITETGYKCMWKSIIRKMEEQGEKQNMKVGIDLTAYIFRHNYACMLMHANIDMKERQYLLGHKTIAMTMDIYTHIDINHMRAPQRLEEYAKSLTKA